MEVFLQKEKEEKEEEKEVRRTPAAWFDRPIKQSIKLGKKRITIVRNNENEFDRHGKFQINFIIIICFLTSSDQT